MENASKALIIAGAIILAVLIIGLGMSVFMQTSSMDPSSDLNSYEVQQFNKKFTDFEGLSVKGSRVLNLCDTVRNHNMQYKDDITKQILIEKVDSESDDFDEDNEEKYNGVAGNGKNDNTELVTQASNVKKDIKSGKTYRVSIQYDAYSNLVTAIHVRDLAGNK